MRASYRGFPSNHHCRHRGRWIGRFALSLALCLVSFHFIICHASSPVPPSSSMVVRLRLADGSMERIQIAEGKEEAMTLEDVLQQFELADDATVKVGNQVVEKLGGGCTLRELGIQHGSIITVVAKSAPKTESSVSRVAKAKQESAKAWNPYPDLAKDYSKALLKTKTRRSTQSGMSYGDIAHLQSSLHMVDPQKEGPLKRVYMCRLSAERFHNNGIVQKKGKSKPDISCRCGLLLGTIQKERVDQHRPKKARTSLSSTTSDSEYCTVAKVQAVWEPPGQSPSKDGMLYDANAGQALLTKYPRVLAIAEKLGLVPMGWIFSYRDSRLEENYDKKDRNEQDHEPQALLGMDVATGAVLQSHNMKQLGRSEGNKFVTLAMDAATGATEAFQLSDVTVQMVHENMFENLVPPPQPPSNSSQKNNPPIVTTKHAVLVDGRETTQLESVLCLVNTAMLSHEGNFAGKTSSSTVKKSNGSLTIKVQKALLKALDSDDRAIFEELCDFNVLMALDQSLSPTDMDTLCGLVKKWARGQKQGTTLDSKLKLQLKSVLV
ncbi:NPL4 family protein [Nitzschia inconspicua]|uniref:NPL4 family protein n=1 Tax=Nitzschia inconspicua TaxID=303405 RepID=A0A9K3KI69_9STRA|nr:NPL4 family protein [Nitzschia inconspicua]